MIAKHFSSIRPGVVHVIVLSVALTACVDLTPPWSGHEDAGRVDAGAGQAGAGGANEVGQVDSGATEQTPSVVEEDAAVGQDGQASSGAHPDTARNIDTNAGTNTATSTDTNTTTSTSVDASADRAGSGGADEVGQVDFGAEDQAPPAVDSDAALGWDGQDSSGAHPDAVTNADTNTGTGIVADGTYRVIARHSGKALDVYGNATADGSNVDQWTYDGSKNQRWTLKHLDGNVYEIFGVESGKALEVATTSTADDTNVDIRMYSGAANQRWTISALSGGYFRLTPVSSSGSALDVGGASMTDGANVHQWTWLGGNNYNQQWSFQAP